MASINHSTETYGVEHAVMCNGKEVGKFDNRLLARQFAEDESFRFDDVHIVVIAATGAPVYFVQYGKWFKIQAR